MIRLCFLIRSLDRGGAERQLTELIKGLDRSRFAVTVATFYDGGALRPEIESTEGVQVLSLHKKGRWDALPSLWRLAQIIRQVKPQIVHGYLAVANELALMGRLAGAKVVWGLRASNVDFSRYDWFSAWSFRIAAWLSRFTDLIVVNSHAGKRHHVAQGYCGTRMLVIHNGFDTARFHPDDEAGRRMRRAWGIGAHERLIGLVGRLDPMKDHPTFLRAAVLLARARQDVRFVCVGDGPVSYRRELQALATELGLGERLVWAGALSDMRAVYNALDIATSSSSFGEGFSNVTGEAMACGVPCVVTDVGDSATIVGNSGQIVPPGAPPALLAAWERLLDLPIEDRAALGRAARERIVDEYSLQQLVCKTEAALTTLL